MDIFKNTEQTVEQDWDSLRRHLLKHDLILNEQQSPRQFASGFGNLNYLIKLNDNPYVLRRPPLGPIPPGANDMKREYRILSRLHKKYPLAPKAIHFSDDETILGAPFFIMEYRPGLVIGGTLPHTYQNWKDSKGRKIGVHISEILTDNLAEFHKIRPSDIDLDTLGRPEGFNQRTVEGWMNRVERAWPEPLPHKIQNIGLWLQKNLPEEGHSTLLHNDFKLDNLILDPNSLMPVAVIDWDMGTQGPPLFDLCVMLSYWVEKDDPKVMRDLNQMPTDKHGFFNRRQIAERYAKQAGISLQNITFYRVLAMLRLAGIFIQLNKRFREGSSKDQRFSKFDILADELMDFTAEIITGKYY